MLVTSSLLNNVSISIDKYPHFGQSWCKTPVWQPRPILHLHHRKRNMPNCDTKIIRIYSLKESRPVIHSQKLTTYSDNLQLTRYNKLCLKKMRIPGRLVTSHFSSLINQESTGHLPHLLLHRRTARHRTTCAAWGCGCGWWKVFDCWGGRQNGKEKSHYTLW